MHCALRKHMILIMTDRALEISKKKTVKSKLTKAKKLVKSNNQFHDFFLIFPSIIPAPIRPP